MERTSSDLRSMIYGDSGLPEELVAMVQDRLQIVYIDDVKQVN